MKNTTTRSRLLCLGCPSALPSTFYHPDTKNATLWSHSSCLGCPSAFPPPFTTQTQRMRPQGRVLRVWMVPLPFSSPPTTIPSTSSLPLVSNTRTSPHRLILVFGHVPSSLPCLEHHNMPMWACSGAWAPLLSLSSLPLSFLILNIRMSPQGLVLMFGHLTSPLPISNTRTSPHRLIHIPHLEQHAPLLILCCCPLRHSLSSSHSMSGIYLFS